jgi:hypothetical protein
VNDPEYVELGRGDLSPVLAYMEQMAESHTGWINFEAAIHVEDAPPPKSGLFGLFSSRGPDVPLVTWTPGEVRKGRTEPTTVGILHPSGPRASKKVEVPEGWVVLQDYSKKGLVLAVPPGVGHEKVIDWLLGAATALSVIPLTGEWRAAVYRP